MGRHRLADAADHSGGVGATARGNACGAKGPYCCDSSDEWEAGQHDKGPDESPRLQRRIYVKAKAEPSWRFWAGMSMSAKWRSSAKLIVWPRPTTEPQGLTGSRLRTSRPAG